MNDDRQHLGNVIRTMAKSLSLVLDKELGITVVIGIDDELSELETRRRILVRSDDGVERVVSCVFTLFLPTATRRSRVRFGRLTDEGSTEQNSREEHVQRCTLPSPSAFIRQI